MKVHHNMPHHIYLSKRPEFFPNTLSKLKITHKDKHVCEQGKYFCICCS